MAIWSRTLNISDIFLALEEETISPSEGIKQILHRFTAIKPYDIEHIEESRQRIIEDIEMIIDDENDNEDVDYVLTELYDFGDIKISGGFFDAVKACWIKTRF